jgi:abortive infection bacteriophage resistance protein
VSRLHFDRAYNYKQHSRHASAHASATLAVFFASRFLMITSHPVPYSKCALSYDEQLSLLKQRGLVVPDRPYAIDILSRISYYRLSAYWHPFRMKDADGLRQSQLQPGTTFEDVLSLYEFDRKLRLLVLDALERVEVSIRTAVTHCLGKVQSTFAHEDPNNFHPRFAHKAWVVKLHHETLRQANRR